ncbi:thioredoxin family protein [Dictyobacter alpinus]|nr:thioredoxin family protein [Dictyobacter alpinus]
MTSEQNHLFAVTDQNFESLVLQSALPVIVDFWAEWCPHCHALRPGYERLSTIYAGKVGFATMNADENPLAPARFGVQGLPTLILFNAGKPVTHIVGPHPNRLPQRIEQALAEITLPQIQG